MTAELTSRPRTTRTDVAATVISEVFAPIVVIPLVVVIVSLHAADSATAGLGYALIAILFSAGVPYAVLMLALARGRISDRQVRERRQRPVIMAAALVSVTLGLLLLGALHAPRDLIALVAAMVLGMASALAVSLRWKISMHSSCVAGAVTSVAVIAWPWAWLLLVPISALVGWARMVHRHHTASQVAAGALLGTGVAALILIPLAAA